jgi:hypothetical protein
MPAVAGARRGGFFKRFFGFANCRPQFGNGCFFLQEPAGYVE